MISAKWISLWKKFVNGETSQPGPIGNSALAELIMQRRKRLDYPMHDNKLMLKEPDDFYQLSQDFWDMFRERYGCDIAIQLRRYDTFSKVLPPTFQQGTAYSSYDV